MSTVVLASEFSADNVSYKEPRKNAIGGQSILLNYWNPATKKNGPLILQTPRMRIPFGHDMSESDNGGPSRYSLNASMANGDSQNANLVTFTELIRELDTITKDTACQLSDVWFGKKQKPEILEEFYKSAEKKSKNDKYPSTLKLKLPIKVVGDSTVPQFDIYSESKELVNILDDSGLNLSCLEKGSDIVAIIQCTGVWFVGKTQFGLGWKIVQLKTYRTQKLVGYSIVDDDPEEEEEEVEVEEVEEVEEEETTEVG